MDSRVGGSAESFDGKTNEPLGVSAKPYSIEKSCMSKEPSQDNFILVEDIVNEFHELIGYHDKLWM